MGESKRRGSFEQRFQQAKAHIFRNLEENMPSDLRCNECDSVLDDVVSLPEYVGNGLTHVYVASCDACQCFTYAAAGTEAALALFYMHLENEHGSSPLTGACSNVSMTK